MISFLLKIIFWICHLQHMNELSNNVFRKNTVLRFEKNHSYIPPSQILVFLTSLLK